MEKLYASSQCKFRGVTFQGHLDCCTTSLPEQVFSGSIAMYKVIDLDEKLFLQGKEGKEGKEDRGVQGKRRCRGHQQECNRGCQDLAG